MKDKVTGASDGDNTVDIDKETKANIVDGDAEKKVADINIDDESKAELEDLRKTRAGQDKKISILLAEKEALKKEREKENLAGKSAKEQNEIYQKKIKALEAKESFRVAFKNSGLNADEWECINGDDHLEKASKIVEIFNREKEAYANEKLEAFKRSELEKVGKNIPNINNNEPAKEEVDPHLELAEKMKKNV